MKVETIKDTIFKTGVKSIPKAIWVFCASYALIMLTNLFVLNFAHIDADKHINRYLDILLTNKENNQQCDIKVNERLTQLEINSHEPSGPKID